MAVDDHGIEVLKKAGEEVTLGDKSDYYIKTSVINPSDFANAAATPVIYNKSVPAANTEVSQALSTNTKKFTIKVRGNAGLKLAYIATESSTNFITIPAGAVMSEDGLNVVGLTLYFQTDKSSQIVEIKEWT